MSPANGAFSTGGHVVIVGASLAGLRAAESLRKEGFRGRLTLVGDEPYEPYDRPPLSKQVLTGRVAPESTALPQAAGLDAEWRLGTPAVGLDLAGKRVRLADGDEVGFDRLLIATGTRARPWPNPAEAALDGVLTLRSRDDAARLRRELSRRAAPGPGHRRRVHRLGDRLGLPRAGPAGDGRRTRGDAAGRCARRGDRRGRGAAAARARRRPALRGQRHRAGRRRRRACAPRPPGRRHHAGRRRGRGRARRAAQHRVAAGLGPRGGPAGRRLRRRVPRLRHVRHRHRRHLRRRRRRPLPAPAVRVPVPGAGALEQRGRAGRGRGPQHGARRVRAAPLSARPDLLVVPVRRQHQVGRGADPRRGGGHRPGIDRRAPLRRRLRPPRSHRGRGHRSTRASGWSSTWIRSNGPRRSRRSTATWRSRNRGRCCRPSSRTRRCRPKAP